jgi:hypothetical protein
VSNRTVLEGLHQLKVDFPKNNTANTTISQPAMNVIRPRININPSASTIPQTLQQKTQPKSLEVGF